MSHSIEFRLFAPGNEVAFLAGSFLGGSPLRMEQDARGFFRASVRLEDGIHQYWFRVLSRTGVVESWVEVNDPYVKEIDPETGRGVVRIRKGRWVGEEYVWQNDSATLPAHDELVIYELCVPEFGHRGNEPGRLLDVVDRLGHLTALGVSAVELVSVLDSPQSAQGCCDAPRHHMAVHPRLGRPSDLKRLVDECHARGLRVLLDLPLGHSSDDCPFFRMDEDYWYEPHHRSGRRLELNYDFSDEDIKAQPVRDYVADVVLHWIHEYHIDGIRYDSMRYSDTADLLAWIVPQARQALSGRSFFNMSDELPGSNELVSPKGPVDGWWHEGFHRVMLPHLRGDVFNMDMLKKAINPRLAGFPDGPSSLFVVSLGNHEAPRLVAELLAAGLSEEEAFSRVKLGAALLMTAVGVPLLWMGDELGETTSPGDVGRLMDWTRLECESSRRLMGHFATLIALRRKSRALRSPNVHFFHENSEARLFAFLRWDDGGETVLVAVNFSSEPRHGVVLTHVPIGGRWHDAFGGEGCDVQGTRMHLDLAPFEVRILTHG